MHTSTIHHAGAVITSASTQVALKRTRHPGGVLFEANQLWATEIAAQNCAKCLPSTMWNVPSSFMAVPTPLPEQPSKC